jgi:L-ascorbate metabolism protein UlaG (beta-lactamase superfamily)
MAASGLSWGGRALRHSGDLAEFDRWIVDDDREPGDGRIRVTFLGTTMFLVDDGEDQILIDAFLTTVPVRHAILGRPTTDRARVDAILREVGARRVGHVVIAHSHHDHALDAAYVTAVTGATLVGTESTVNIGRGGGLPADRMHLAVPGEEIISGNFRITVLASRHSPGVVGGEGACIHAPLAHPRHVLAYKEGGCLDVLVRHGDQTLLFKASANHLPGALDDVRADVLFLGVATLGRQDQQFRDAFARATIGAVRPRVVVPAHWNDFFSPLSHRLPLNRRLVDDAPASLHEIRRRCDEYACEFRILDGYGRLVLGP